MADPTKLIDAFAHNAGPTFITDPIPETTATPGAASFDQGFPPDTMTAPAAGGVPPFGQDMNGILFMTTSVIAFLNKGQTFVYDSVFAAAIGGYVAGTILSRSDHTGFWLAIATTSASPETGTPGTNGWIAINNYGYTSQALSNANVTLTALQAARPVIILTGVLTANVQLILPKTLQSWLIVNNTSGAFTLTVKTSTGTGVVVAQGGFTSPTGVYGDGTNIYNSFSPLTVPISQSATPLTLAERTNAGYLLATYFNQSSGVENPTIGSVFVQNSAADGFLRKISLANFIAQLPAGGLISRSVSGNEVTYSVGGGALVVKVGIVAQTVAANQAHNFAVAFPTDCDQCITCVADSTGVEFFSVVSASTTLTGFTQYSNNTCNVTYIAIGH
jgi:hypothetical protein